MTNSSLPHGSYKWLENLHDSFYTILSLLKRMDQRDCSLEIELHDSVKNFVFKCIVRPVPTDFLSPFDISAVEAGGMHWTPSEQ